MHPRHVTFADVYEAMAEVTKIIRQGGFAYVLRSTPSEAVVSIY